MEIIKCTAWDCLGVHSEKVDNTHLIRIVGGRTLYEAAYVTQSQQTVRLARLATDGPMVGIWPGLHQVNRYVAWDTPVELVPIAK